MAKPLIYRVPQAAAALGISRATLYRMIKRGELELVKIGCTRSSGIPADSVDAMLQRSRAEAGSPSPTDLQMGSQMGS